AAAWRCGLEDAARRARYAFLEEAAARAGASKIALAHQLEDQAETLLLHLVHGCGLEGLGAMRPKRGNRIRPLLDVSRAELEAYLRGVGVTWREDATNQDVRHARNLLRHTVFPALRTLNPRVAEAMARTAGQAARASEALHARAESLLSGRIKRMPYGAFWIVEGICPTAEAVRAFAKWAGVPVLNARASAILAGLPPGEAESLPGGWRALRTEKRLHLLGGSGGGRDWSETDFTSEPGLPGDVGDGVHVQSFDADALTGAVFRARREGDLFAPLGLRGKQKLKQTLRDAGIDRPFRDLLPLLAKGNRVLWIVGVKPSGDAAVGEKTREIVKIRYTGALPWEMLGEANIADDGGCRDDQRHDFTDV
ncbi:MAG: tRNA lysidine(34) synthetase TilS, partial [Firmicutes bacterium]|nr:tRNA lysidine(34) synthetase TilS [Bacillota bacterium]